MRKISLGLAMVSLALFTMFSTGHAEMVDRIVAIVNDDVITMTELNQAIAPYLEKINTAGYAGEKKDQIVFKLKIDMLNRMIDRKLTDQEVKKLGFTVTEKEIDAAIERLKESQMMTQDDLENALKADGMDFAKYREKIREEILRPKLINYTIKSKVVVTDADIKAYYDKHAAEYIGAKKYHLFNILVTINSAAPDELKAQKEELLATIMKRLANGEDFKSLAREFSESPNASSGGELGLFAMDSLADKLKVAIAEIGSGQHTDVILTDQGYQIFFVESIVESNEKGVAEVKDEISKKIYDEIVEKKFTSWLESLRKNSHIKTML